MIINGIDFDKRCDLEKIELKLRIDRRVHEQIEKEKMDEHLEYIDWLHNIMMSMYGIPKCITG